MKLVFVAATVAAVLASAAPTLARDPHDRRHHAPPPRRMAYAHRFHEGQIYHGHRLAYRGGYWGYYQPHNGVFIHINI